MPVAAQIRAEIEAALAQRIPSALTPSPRGTRATVATGVDAIDELLGGGLPVRAISELVGPECSGRTTLALAFLAEITRQGKVCAWVDVSDTLHPASAAAAGVDLNRLLWVRCGEAIGEATMGAKRFQDSPLSMKAPQTSRVLLGGNSPHPRSESKGLPSAIGDLLGPNSKYKRSKIIGTPGAPNRPLADMAPNTSTPASREEQIASDRLPARRGVYVLEQREAYEPRCAGPLKRPRPEAKRHEPVATGSEGRPASDYRSRKPWSRLDQALRATDLLLQAGGFSAIVLDMGSIPADFASRVPLATWFRYRAAAERTQASFLLLTQHPCAKSSAEVTLRLYDPQPIEDGATVFAGLKIHAELARRRFEKDDVNIVSIRKPPKRADVAEWRSRSAWTMRPKTGPERYVNHEQ